MPLTIEQFNLLQLGTTNYCILIRVVPTDDNGGEASQVAAALHTRNLIFDSIEYKAFSIEISERERNAGVAVDNATFRTRFNSIFTKLGIKGGKWQGATVTITVVNYLNLAAGYVFRQRGRFGQAQTGGREATVEYRGLGQLLTQEIGDRTSRLCRYRLGVWNGIDSFCPVDLNLYKFAGTVGTVTNRQKFVISVVKPDDYFYRGTIKFTSGANAGLSMETQQNTGTLLTLFRPMPGAVVFGDAFEIIAGDDKTLQTCHNKFNAALDHGGEDCMPDPETLFAFPEI